MSLVNAGTTLFRRGLLVESAGNVFGGLAMCLFPHQVLSAMTYTTTPITPLSIELVQWLGGLCIALTTPLLLSYPNTIAGVTNRYTTYWTLGAGEAILIALIGRQMMSESSTFTLRSLTAFAAVLGGTLAWRLFCVFGRPDLIGSVSDESKTR